MVDFPAVRALPAQCQQQAKQALRAIRFSEAPAVALAATATTQRLMVGLAVLVDKVVAVAAAAG